VEGAEIVCERLRQSVEATSFRVEDDELELTVSCGIALHEQGESLSGALDRARLALAEARKSGRNRTAKHDGTAAHVVQHHQYQVTGNTIEVAAG
jgi:PleD family two-component response regulator